MMRGMNIVHRTDIRLVREIASGGMGTVYEGHQLGYADFVKVVAVKMLNRATLKQPDFKKLLVEEAKLVCNLVHENIVQIYQLGCLTDGRCYVVMEYVDGQPLHDMILALAHDRERLPVALAVHICSRIARGLAYAHDFCDRQGTALNIVHRDVCPRNILVTTEGLAKLTDFGIAKMVNALVQDGTLTGKIRFMSPEQAACRPLDRRTDVFSLGAVLFNTLSGAFIRPDTCNPTRDDFEAMPVPWDQLPQDLPEDLLAIMRRMLAFDPADRYPDCDALAQDLEYHIYKDGYGPTIQTVEKFMRENLPALYERQPLPSLSADGETLCDVTLLAGPDETLLVDDTLPSA